MNDSHQNPEKTIEDIKNSHQALSSLFSYCVSEDKTGACAFTEEFKNKLKSFNDINRIILTGAGSSYNAVYAGMYFFNSISRIDATAVLPSELFSLSRVKNLSDNTLLIVISQSGKTQEICKNVETSIILNPKIKILALTTTHSKLWEMIEQNHGKIFDIKFGTEEGKTSTIFYINSVMALYLLACYYERDSDKAKEWLKYIKDYIADYKNHIDWLVKEYHKKDSKHTVFIEYLAKDCLKRNKSCDYVTIQNQQYKCFNKPIILVGTHSTYACAKEGRMKVLEFANYPCMHVDSTELKHATINFLSPLPDIDFWNIPIIFLLPISETDYEHIKNDIENTIDYAFLSIFKRGKIKKETYLFIWDEIPGNDNGILVEFLEQTYRIVWAKSAKIEKIDDDRTINISTEKNSLSLRLNNEKTKVNLKIDDGRTDELNAKTENGKLNIYKEIEIDIEKIIKEIVKKTVAEMIQSSEINEIFYSIHTQNNEIEKKILREWREIVAKIVNGIEIELGGAIEQEFKHKYKFFFICPWDLEKTERWKGYFEEKYEHFLTTQLESEGGKSDYDDIIIDEFIKQLESYPNWWKKRLILSIRHFFLKKLKKRLKRIFIENPIVCVPRKNLFSDSQFVYITNKNKAQTPSPPEINDILDFLIYIPFFWLFSYNLSKKLMDNDNNQTSEPKKSPDNTLIRKYYSYKPQHPKELEEHLGDLTKKIHGLARELVEEKRSFEPRIKFKAYLVNALILVIMVLLLYIIKYTTGLRRSEQIDAAALVISITVFLGFLPRIHEYLIKNRRL